MSTLYELTDEWQQLVAMMDDPDVDPQLIKDTLEGLSGEIEEKGDNYAKVIKMYEDDIATIDSEIKRLTALKQSRQKNIERMKESLKNAMAAIGKVKFKTSLFNFGIRKNPAKMIVDDATKVPAYYWVVPEPKPEINKALLKEDLKKGETIEGAHLEQGESLTIK